MRLKAVSALGASDTDGRWRLLQAAALLLEGADAADVRRELLALAPADAPAIAVRILTGDAPPPPAPPPAPPLITGPPTHKK